MPNGQRCGAYKRHWFTVKGQPSHYVCIRCGALNPRYVR
ncbi:hypothetical protein LCGC14_0529080 [marine sediment metagenome]|uniref:Uncharacterized protein n=1 Tax=marine sediment metagenome TaxID=412755 RepID=A0A0F9S0U3_9ZZZZ